MGGPSHLGEVEVFLRNMFKDPYILPIKNSLIRKFVGSMIVKKRLEKAKQNYRAIGGRSPMVGYTFSLCQKLQEKNPERFYSYTMRYTPPFTDMALKEMQQKGIEKIYLFSMYPQYSSTTTLSSFSEVHRCLRELNYKPVIEIIERYYDNAFYHKSMLNSILKTINDLDSRDFILIFSAHSLPQNIIDSGDPYQQECEKTFEYMKELLKENNLIFKDVLLSYQSRIGKMKWIGPSTQSLIEEHAKENLLLYPLGFTIDNSETAFEINIEYRQLAKALGNKIFLVSPCFNDSEDFVDFILNLIGEK